MFAVPVRILLLLSLALAIDGHAGELQAEFGQCRFGLERDGTFYQSNLPTHNYMTPRCGALGIADAFGGGPFGWRIGFVWAEDIEARDNVTTLSDQDAFKSNLTCITARRNRGRGCLVSHSGSGQTWGFSFSGTVEQRLGFASVVAEAGLFFFRHRWHSHADQINCTTCAPAPDYDESHGPFADPSPLLGLTLKIGYVYFAARHYWPGEHRPLSLTDHSFTQLSTGLRYRF